MTQIINIGLLAVAMVCIGLWTQNIYILLLGTRAYMQDKTLPLQELELKMQGGLMCDGGGGGVIAGHYGDIM